METLTDQEKRFVLAEMIKNSTIEVGSLATFVRSSRIEPDWLCMQLPPGRNMNQCIMAAEQMDVSTTLKRRLSNEHPEHEVKRIATSGRSEYALHGSYRPGYHTLAPSAMPPVAILPRPSNGVPIDYREARPLPKPEPSKKRGRPSRADKAKRNLQPLLPRPPATQPAPGYRTAQSSPGHQIPQQITPQAGPATPAPLSSKRTRVPSLSTGSTAAARPITPPEVYISTPRSSGSPREQASTTSPSSDRTRTSAPKGGNVYSRASRSPTKQVLAD